MNTYHYKDFDINIYESPGITENSTDNRHFDKMLKTIDAEDPVLSKYYEIEVAHADEVKTVLLETSSYPDSHAFTALHADGVFMMLNDVLAVFSPKKLDFIRTESIDPFGVMMEVHPFEDDYILYGETEIYRIGSDLKVKWQFSGRDIFIRYQGEEPAFLMKSDRICLIDFLDNYYEIDYDGKLLTDRPFYNES